MTARGSCGKPTVPGESAAVSLLCLLSAFPLTSAPHVGSVFRCLSPSPLSRLLSPLHTAITTFGPKRMRQCSFCGLTRSRLTPPVPNGLPCRLRDDKDGGGGAAQEGGRSGVGRGSGSGSGQVSSGGGSVHLQAVALTELAPGTATDRHPVALQRHTQRHRSLAAWQQKRRERQYFPPNPPGRPAPSR